MDLIPLNQSREVLEMIFIEDNHVLIWFKNGTFVTFSTKGEIVEQKDDEVKKWLSYANKIIA